MQIHPYLIFSGNCREAMLFYQSCLGGELSLQTIHDSPMAGEWPDEVQDQILHATLMNGQTMIMASDMGGREDENSNGRIFISLTCSTGKEIKDFFTKLSEGGQITRPLHEFYAGTIGAITDKFGMNWLLYL